MSLRTGSSSINKQCSNDMKSHQWQAPTWTHSWNNGFATRVDSYGMLRFESQCIKKNVQWESLRLAADGTGFSYCLSPVHQSDMASGFPSKPRICTGQAFVTHWPVGGWCSSKDSLHPSTIINLIEGKICIELLQHDNCELPDMLNLQLFCFKVTAQQILIGHLAIDKSPQQSKKFTKNKCCVRSCNQPPSIDLQC